MLGRGLGLGFLAACGSAPAPVVKNTADVAAPATASLAPPVPWKLESGPAGALALTRFATPGAWTYGIETRGTIESSALADPSTHTLDTKLAVSVTTEGRGSATIKARKEAPIDPEAPNEKMEVTIDAAGRTMEPMTGEVVGLILPVPPTGLAVGATQERPFEYPLAAETGTVQTGTEQVTFRGYTTVGGIACAWFDLHAVIAIEGGENEIHGQGVYDRHACFDPRDASLVAATVGSHEDITIVSTTTFADGESYGPMSSRRVSKVEHHIARR